MPKNILDIMNDIEKSLSSNVKIGKVTHGSVFLQLKLMISGT